MLVGLVLAACTPSQSPGAKNHPDLAPPSVVATASTALLLPTPFASPAYTLAAAAPSETPEPTVTLTASPNPTNLPAPFICRESRGAILEDSLPSQHVPLPLEYRLYLPPCYDQQLDRRYPVLYLIHGKGFNHDQWDRLGIDESADILISKGEIQPFLIVMPRDRSWVRPERDGFGQALIEDLLPLIDQTYRTLPEREYRALGGLSRGASWTIHLGLSYWELFGTLGAHSLPVFWTDRARIPNWLEEIPPDEMPRIYLDIGEKDFSETLRWAAWFEELLTGQGVPHEWHLNPGYHDEAYWEAHIEDYIRWYGGGWEIELNPSTASPPP
jgi:enterochelin esterase-like enzyme